MSNNTRFIYALHTLPKDRFDAHFFSGYRMCVRLRAQHGFYSDKFDNINMTQVHKHPY